MIESRYIIFHFLLLLSTYLACRGYLKQSQYSYWKIAIIPIAIFTIEEGLRYGREIDWCVYYDVYSDIKNGVDTGHEVLFTMIWKLFGLVDAPYYILIACCSAFFIYSLFFLFKSYKEALFLIIPICILYEAPPATNLIRFFMGLSFFFIATRCFLENKRSQALIFTFASIFVHVGLILLIPLVWILLIKKHTITKPRTSIIICLLLIIFFDKGVLAHFSFIFDVFKDVDRFAHYASDSVLWLTSNGDHDYEQRDIKTNLITSIPLFFVIYHGYKIVKVEKELTIFYNLMLVGIYLRYISMGLELMSRYVLYFYPFLSFFMGIVLIRLSKRRKNLSSLCAIILIVGFVLMKTYNFCISQYDTDMLMRYVWDGKLDPSFFLQYYNTQ